MKKPFVALIASVTFSAVFGGLLDNAWIKGETDKNPVSYKTGEEMRFKLTMMGLEGNIPPNGTTPCRPRRACRHET